MAGAIAKGLLATGVVKAENIHVYDVIPAKRDGAAAAGFQASDSPVDLARNVTVLILAPKPQDMPSALASIQEGVSSETLLVSVAAGISTGAVRKVLGDDFRVVRVMPNTPALVGAGAAGVAGSPNCSARDIELALALFRAVGGAEACDESQIDAVTGVSGSGPAYFFYFVECLVEAGVSAGLPEELATTLAVDTLYGAGKLLKESGETPAALRERVTSKGGTTFSALQHFRANDLEKIVRESVEAAVARSRELGQ